MVCGQCGTKINPGFNTCPSCGVTYQKSASGLVRTLLFIASVGFLLLGLFFIAYGLIANRAPAAAPFGVLLMAAGAGIAWLINKTAPYK